ncbi:vitamin B12 ABC transporter ATP-binding protein BtuD [Vibrio sp. RC27]
MIIVNNLSVDTRLNSSSFSIEKGEKIHLIGPNGSGKSSLLAALSGVLPARGIVDMAGADLLQMSISRQATLRAYLSQNDQPSFHVKVHQYLMLSHPEDINFKPEEFEQVVRFLVERLSLSEKLNDSILNLSGGEWQRVRLAGIFLQVWPSLNPSSQLLILDEPAAALDIGQEKLLYQLIDEVAKLGIAVVVANHDLNRAIQYADKALVLHNGEQIAFGEVNSVIEPDLIGKIFDTSVKAVKVNNRTHLVFD